MYPNSLRKCSPLVGSKLGSAFRTQNQRGLVGEKKYVRNSESLTGNRYTRGERSFLTNEVNKMAGRTPGAQETWQEMTSHSLLHNYASLLPWIDIYTANIAFPPLALHPRSSLASIRAQNRPRARRWKGNPANSMVVAFSGDGFRWRWNCRARNWKQIGAQEKPGKRRAGKKGGKPLYVQRRPRLAYTRPGQV